MPSTLDDSAGFPLEVDLDHALWHHCYHTISHSKLSVCQDLTLVAFSQLGLQTDRPDNSGAAFTFKPKYLVDGVLLRDLEHLLAVEFEQLAGCRLHHDCMLPIGEHIISQQGRARQRQWELAAQSKLNHFLPQHVQGVPLNTR